MRFLHTHICLLYLLLKEEPPQGIAVLWYVGGE